MAKYAECSICGDVVEVTNSNSSNGEYPDLDGWVINEYDYSIRCSNWECQETPGKLKSGAW